MLTIDPARRFIMPRATARDHVEGFPPGWWRRPESHSSSRIRSRMLSRVIPALLTRMETGPERLLHRSHRLLARGRSRRRRRNTRHGPRPTGRPRQPQLSPRRGRARPPSLPPSPTRADTARPMPRDPPVTIATESASRWCPPPIRAGDFLGSSFADSMRSIDSGVPSETRRHALRVPAVEARQHLARPEFGEALHTQRHASAQYTRSTGRVRSSCRTRSCRIRPGPLASRLRRDVRNHRETPGGGIPSAPAPRGTRRRPDPSGANGRRPKR